MLHCLLVLANVLRRVNVCRIQQENGGPPATSEQPAAPVATPSKKKPVDEDDDGDDFDDDDLLADASEIVSRTPTPSDKSRSVGPTAFGSITLSMSRAHHGLGNFFENLAKRAPPMPRLGGARKH